MSPRTNPSDKHSNGKAFELLSREVLAAVLSTQNKGDQTRILHNIRLTGVSGVRHQIDLECVLRKDENDQRFLVECKDQERPVSQEKVSAFRSVLDDLDLPGIMISSSGYQSGALRYALHAGIIPLELRPPDPMDWKDYVRAVLRAENSGNAPKGLKDITLSGFSNLRVHIIAEPSPQNETVPRSKAIPLPSPDDLQYEPGLMLLEDSAGRRYRMDQLISRLTENAAETHPVLSVPVQGGRLRHLIRDWQLPVREIRLEFDNLSEDFREAVLYEGNPPDLILINHANQTRRNLYRKANAKDGIPSFTAGPSLPDPVHRISACPLSAPIPGPEEE